MISQTITTREELQEAKNKGVEEIIVNGELANKIKKAKAITKLGAAGLSVLTVVLGASAVAAPVTGGLSLFAAVPAAALTGTGVVAIITASALGIGLIIALFKDYEEIEFSPGKLVLRKKAKA